MKRNYLLTLAALMLVATGCDRSGQESIAVPTSTREVLEMGIELPEPVYDSDISLEETLLNRRSVREYSDQPVTLAEVSQLLWAAQGVTDQSGSRTAPSAGALYPLEVYIVMGNVQDMAAGVYWYDPAVHQLSKTVDGDVRSILADAALGQTCVDEAAIDLVFTAIYQRTTGTYGDRGVRYIHMEAGHAAQNVCLQAVALDLGAVVIGAFYEDEVSEVLNLPSEEHPLYIIPVGRE